MRGAQLSADEALRRKQETMLAQIEAGAFIETANVFGQNLYGTSLQTIIDCVERGQIPLLDIDIQGSLAFSFVHSFARVFTLYCTVRVVCVVCVVCVVQYG